MRLFLSLTAAGLIALGVWMIASGFSNPGSSRETTGPVASARPQTGNIIVLGTTLLVGGGGLFLLLLRRR